MIINRPKTLLLLLSIVFQLACEQEAPQEKRRTDFKSSQPETTKKEELPPSHEQKTQEPSIPKCPETYELKNGMCLIKITQVTSSPTPEIKEDEEVHEEVKEEVHEEVKEEEEVHEELVAELTCPSGTEKNANNECVPIVPQCIGGQVLSADHVCVCTDPKMTFAGNTCVCPIGQNIQNGSCVIGDCPPNTVRYEGEEVCETVSVQPCAAGQFLSGVNECISIEEGGEKIVLPAISTGLWVQESEQQISQVATGLSGDWAIDQEGGFYKYTNSQWVTVSGTDENNSQFIPSHISSGKGGVWSVEYKQSDSSGNMPPRKVYFSNGTDTKWIPIADRFTKIADGPNGVWALNESNQVFKRKNETWELKPGLLKHVSDGMYGLWGVSRSNEAYKWNGSNWDSKSSNISDISSGFYGVWAIVASNNTVSIFQYPQILFGSSNYYHNPQTGSTPQFYGVDTYSVLNTISSGDYGVWGIKGTTAEVYFRYDIDKGNPSEFSGCSFPPCRWNRGLSWGTPDSSKRLTQISSGKQGVWGLDQNRPYQRTGVVGGGSSPYISGGGWAERSTPPNGLIYVESGNTGLWGIEKETNKLYLRKSDGTWELKTPLNLRKIFAGPYGVWALDDEGKAFFRKGKGVVAAAQNQGVWIKIGETPLFKQISVGDFGVWAISKENTIYFRSGAVKETDTTQALEGNSWTQIRGQLSYISSSSRGIFGVDSEKRIFFRYGASEADPQAGSWIEMTPPAKLNLVAVEASNSRIWGINDNHKLVSTSAPNHQFANRTGTNGNKEFQNKALKSIFAGTVEACAKLCSETVYCNGFSFRTFDGGNVSAQNDCKLMVEMTGTPIDVPNVELMHYRKIFN
ncbi:MAG: hypothetical protein HYW48_11820 [Deltaproteobacteria bacterium]|nr:hypothetical protein [Deltaproteobacteria bacterium]